MSSSSITSRLALACLLYYSLVGEVGEALPRVDFAFSSVPVFEEPIKVDPLVVRLAIKSVPLL